MQYILFRASKLKEKYIFQCFLQKREEKQIHEFLTNNEMKQIGFHGYLLSTLQDVNNFSSGIILPAIELVSLIYPVLLFTLDFRFKLFIGPSFYKKST